MFSHQRVKGNKASYYRVVPPRPVVLQSNILVEVFAGILVRQLGVGRGVIQGIAKSITFVLFDQIAIGIDGAEYGAELAFERDEIAAGLGVERALPATGLA